MSKVVMSEIRDRVRGEIREEMAKRVYTDWNKDPEYTWETLPEYRKKAYRDWVDEEVFKVMASMEANYGIKSLFTDEES